MSTELSRPPRKRARLALAIALTFVGCSGAGSGCGSSCGGAFSTTTDGGVPIKFTGSRLDNVAQIRMTASGFTFLNAAHLNDIFTQLNSTLAIPCAGPTNLLSCSSTFNQTEANVLVGDTNFNGQCDATDTTPMHITAKDVTWTLDPADNVLKAHLVMHLQTGDIYIRTVERHSSICGDSNSPIQARVKYDDETAGLPQADTTIDLNIGFSTTPDGRLEFNFDQQSLLTSVSNFQPGAVLVDSFAGTDPAPPATGTTPHDACGGSGSTYTPASGGSLDCGIPDTDCNDSGALCTVVKYVRGYLLDYLKNTFAPQIVSILRSQLDNIRCQRAINAAGSTVACSASIPCPTDDDGTALACDTSRGVCYPPSQSTTNFNCEPIPLGISGELNASALSAPVGFPANAKIDLFAGLGTKPQNGSGAHVDNNGLQIAAEAGTGLPPGALTAPCVQTALPPPVPTIPALDFDDNNNKPSTVGTYDVGFAIASAMLNRGFLDAYNAGMLCVAVTNQTTSLISSSLFKTILPSLGLVTGGGEVPMQILLRPTQPPVVRLGRNTYKTDANGNLVPDDPLITLNFKQMNLDIYALVDERQVRIFTLQADLALPIGLRTFPDPNANTLQPVLGSLTNVLTNISALSPDGGPYSPSVDILSEDPTVIKDLIAAAVQLVQPLLAGIIQPVALPNFFNLQLAVEGVAGAVPMADVVDDGYNHLAIWAKVNECNGTCPSQNVVKAQVKVASTSMPESGAAVRAGARPSITLIASAEGAKGAAEYSYRIDGGLWSPWLQNPKLVLSEPVFLFPGHHKIEVTARDQGDDRSQDLAPPAVDFVVSFEAPHVTLAQRDDGTIVTRASSLASRESGLKYSYRVDGEQSWSVAGAAKTFTADDLQGRTLSVTVTDEAGRSAISSFGVTEGLSVKPAGGCDTAPGGIAWSLLPLFALVAFMARKRTGRA